jgi:anti-sigma factor RsiW
MKPTTCEQLRSQLLDAQRGLLAADDTSGLQEHLLTCAACARVAQEERALSELLHARLARPIAPDALKQRLRARVLGTAGPSVTSVVPVPRRRPYAWSAVAFASAAACVLAVAASLWARAALRPAEIALVREAVNDHLRVLYAAQPIEIESGGIHQVKPWFSGRVDFAPDVAWSGDDEFVLRGGAVGYLLDRKAATFIFQRRLHTISLFVFRTESLPWPEGPRSARVGARNVQVHSLHGFHILLWRAQGLGHALISDASPDALLRLCAKLDQAP